MAKNALGSKARSETRSRSPSVKKHREKRKRSRSKSHRGKDRSRSRGGKKSHSRSRDKKHGRDGRKRSRSKERARKRSRSRKGGGRSRSRRKKSGSRKRSPSKAAEKKKRSPSKAAEKKKRSPSKAAEKKKKSSPKRSPSRKADQRGSPSVKRGSPNRDEKPKDTAKKTSEKTDGGKPDSEENGGDRSDGESAEKDAPVGDTAKDAEEPKAKEEAPPEPPKEMELVTVTFGERPFGMSPQKDAGVEGYVVAKVADGRPADGCGVQVGWRLVAVGEEKCKDQGSETIQALLKKASLPVAVAFERPPSDDPPPDDAEEQDEEKGEEEDELDILDVRADQRRNQSSAMSNIDDLPVERTPEDLPEPITSWQDAVAKGMLNKALLEKLQTAGLKRPTLIQRHAVPVVCHEFGKHDLIAMAQTGSGKTFAFVIPTVARLVLQGAMPRPFFPGKSPGCPLLLVLSPTRELAMQTSKEIEVIAKGTSLTQVCIYGGESLKFQQQRIEKAQIDVLCATPGRLIDLVDSGKISLSFVQSVVLDEADQMLEQSLEVMCAEILTGRDMPEPGSGRQTLLFSATMPQKIREMCPRILRQDRIANLTIGHYGEDQGGSCSSIKQVLRWVPDEGVTRIQVLIEDLKNFWIRPGKKGRVVIFTNQRLQAAHLANALLAANISCVHLHGKLEQHVREEVFDKFRRGMSDVLVATNVASRGLDFPDIALVVQFNLPQNVDIYTHRIGRTGRVGQVGAALGYMGPKDRKLNDKLVEFLELNKQEIPDFLRPRLSPRRRPMRSGRSHSRRRR